jgi:hypothetical protein
MFGWQGLVIPVIAVYLTAQVGLDAETLSFLRDVKKRYVGELEDKGEDLPETIPTVSRKTAVKFALKAQGKVGVLKPTNANRLVYETVLLKLFEEHHVRISERMNLLGEALVACFLRPKQYDMAMEIIEEMGLGKAPDLPL